MTVWYRDVRVAKGSALYDALERRNNAVALGLYVAANAEFKQRYPQCTDEWFSRMNRQDISNVAG